MTLKDKLKGLENKGEERKVNLRMPKNKVDLLEKLAKQFGTNISTLIREMIDDAIMQLQKDLVVLDVEYGVEVTRKDATVETVTYLPSIVELVVPELTLNSYSRDDFSSDEEYDNFVSEDARLKVENGISTESSGFTPISKKEYKFIKKDFK